MPQNDLTVLVIGAGANADFRFKDKKKAEEEKIAMPTGEELVKKIADWEGEVLPNLYYGFFHDLAKNCGADERQQEKMAHFFAEEFGKFFRDSEVRDRPFEVFKEIIHKLKSLSNANVAQGISAKINFQSIGFLGIDPPKKDFLEDAANLIESDEKFGRYHKISQIVKHYQPFSIDEILDSIKIDKIDISKWSDDSEESRRRLIGTGKELIALFLLQSEDKRVFECEASCWYRHLRNAIITCGKNKKEIEEKLKNFVIISFNYDRSLDYFLRTRVGEFYDKIKVIYPYGSLADKEIWSGDDYQKVPYGSAKNENLFQKKWDNFQKAKELAADLKVIGELEEDDDGKKKIGEMQECMKNFGAAYFLGFAFHKENCRVMGMREPEFQQRLKDLRGKSCKDIFYTNFCSSLKLKSEFDSIFNPPATPFELGKSSQKKGVYDALAEDFDLSFDNFAKS